MFRFLDWKIYKDSKKLFHNTKKITQRIPKEYRFEIGNQLIRSSLSVSLNIAEGSGKHTQKEFARYLSIASGSLFEVLAILDILLDQKIITDSEFKEVSDLIQEISKQIGGFRKRLAE